MSTYNLQVLSTAGLEKNASHARVFNQGSQDDQVAALVLGIQVAEGAGVLASQEPSCKFQLKLEKELPSPSPNNPPFPESLGSETMNQTKRFQAIQESP